MVRRAVLLTQRTCRRTSHLRTIIAHRGRRGRRRHRHHLTDRPGHRLTNVGSQCHLLAQHYQRHQPDKAATCDATETERANHEGEVTANRLDRIDVGQQRDSGYARHSVQKGIPHACPAMRFVDSIPFSLTPRAGPGSVSTSRRRTVTAVCNGWSRDRLSINNRRPTDTCRARASRFNRLTTSSNCRG